MKILIGVDDSPHSKAAVEFVRKMSWPEHSQVIAYSVVQLPGPVYAEMYVPSTLPVEVTQEMVRAHRDIATSAQRTLESAGFAAKACILEGDARTALVEAAHDEHADLIVVGSHGRTGISKLFMGSVANHVVTHAPCSVLVVKLEKP